MIEALRLVLIEDNDDDATLVLRELQKGGFDVSSRLVRNAEGLQEALAAGDYDLIISEFSLPSFNGMEALRVVRTIDEDVPFILVSGAIGEDRAVEVMRAGANDCVMKDALQRLSPAVDREVKEAASRRLRREAEASLQMNQARLQAVVENIPFGLCLVDERYKILYQSGPAAELLTSIGTFGPAGELTHIGDNTWLECSSHTDGHRLDINHGEQIFEAFSAKVSEIGGGCVIGIRDVTADRRQLEAFRQQDRLAAIGQLAAGVAHDFNNSLSVIMGFAQLLQMDSSISDQNMSHLERIRNQGRRASELIRQILDFSRNEVADARPLDLVSFLNESKALLGQLLTGSVVLRIETQPASAVVMIEAAQLQQVLANLVVNAKDAMPDGGPITVEILDAGPVAVPDKEMQEGDEWVELRISDTGVGMSEEVQSRIFEPFFTTKAIGEGTGLGMSQVHGIVRQSGGCIRVESEVGSGTVFHLYFPRARRMDVGQEDLDAPRRIVQGGGRLLIVEDDVDVRDMLQQSMESLGFEVVAATDGRAGYQQVLSARGAFRAVITDLDMPGMNGTDMAESIRESYPDLPIIAITGAAQSLAAQSPFDELLTKPIEMDKLVSTLVGTEQQNTHTSTPGETDHV